MVIGCDVTEVVLALGCGASVESFVLVKRAAAYDDRLVGLVAGGRLLLEVGVELLGIGGNIAARSARLAVIDGDRGG